MQMMLFLRMFGDVFILLINKSAYLFCCSNDQLLLNMLNVTPRLKIEELIELFRNIEALYRQSFKYGNE